MANQSFIQGQGVVEEGGDGLMHPVGEEVEEGGDVDL